MIYLEKKDNKRFRLLFLLILGLSLPNMVACTTNMNPESEYTPIAKEIEAIDDALSSLGYGDYSIEWPSDREDLLTVFAEYVYDKNNVGVENIRFNHYLSTYMEDGDITDEEFSELISIIIDTEKYINNFDINQYIDRGADIANLPETYDWAEIDLLFQEYKYVDRKRVLAALFKKITGNESDNTKKHELVLDFLAKGIFHSPKWQPLDKNGELIYDPLALLELHEMRCGNVNRIACDIFDSVGYETRLVQLSGHVIAEIFYDDSWHYFDADTVLNSGSIVKIDGLIPSINQLSEEPTTLDLEDYYLETFLLSDSPKGESQMYPSAHFDFSGLAYSPVYYIKAATDIESLDSHYGWSNADTVNNTDLNFATEKHYQPSIPYIKNVLISDNTIHLEFESSDMDEDILGYTIFVSEHSRGWEYDAHFCDESVSQFIKNRYCAEQYNNLNRIPPLEILTDQTDNNYYDLSLDDGIYHITIMAYDAHGERIGKKWYYPSNELTIEVRN